LLSEEMNMTFSLKRYLLAAGLTCLVATPAMADSVHDNYRYASSTTITLTAPEPTTLSDTSNGTLKAIARGSEVKFTFSSDGNVCKLTGKLSGYSIRFHANQSCTFVGDDMRLTASLTAGSATVDDDGELDLDIVWSIKGNIAGEPVRGTARERTSATPM
jgi:hypothetical protein